MYQLSKLKIIQSKFFLINNRYIISYSAVFGKILGGLIFCFLCLVRKENVQFKDTYVFDFIDKNNINTEKDLKNQMIDNIIKFLNELGPGFSLVGKEYKLNTPSDEDFYIDLLM